MPMAPLCSSAAASRSSNGLASSNKAEIRDGADAFVSRDGRIIAQTVHYNVQPKEPHTEERFPRWLRVKRRKRFIRRRTRGHLVDDER